MGGPGSGRHYRWDSRETTDAFHALDIRRLHQKGLVRPWITGTSRWSRGDREVGSISFMTLGDPDGSLSVQLSYKSGDESFQYAIPVTWTRCNFGGQRPWFICPGTGCGRRVAVLYGGKYFLCRHCHNLAYETTRENDASRYLRKAQKIRERLGRSANIYEPFPDRPKGMHWKTYWRLRSAADESEEASLGALVEWLQRADQRLDRISRSHRDGV